MEENALELINQLRTYFMVEPQYVAGEIQGEHYPKGTFYFYLGGLKFNIIRCITEEDFQLWREKTERMKKLPPIPDRDKRFEIFNAST